MEFSATQPHILPSLLLAMKSRQKKRPSVEDRAQHLLVHQNTTVFLGAEGLAFATRRSMPRANRRPFRVPWTAKLTYIVLIDAGREIDLLRAPQSRPCADRQPPGCGAPAVGCRPTFVPHRVMAMRSSSTYPFLPGEVRM